MMEIGFNRKRLLSLAVIAGALLAGMIVYSYLRRPPDASTGFLRPGSHVSEEQGRQGNPLIAPPAASTESKPLVPSADLARSDGAIGAIRGIVYAPDGKFATDAAVLVRRFDDTMSGARDEPVTGRVAEQGCFELAGLPLGDYGVVSRNGTAFAHGRVRLTEDAPEANIRLVLRAGQPLIGFVQDPVGAPIQGALVVPAWHDAKELSRPESEALAVTTNRDGSFRFPSLSSKAWQLYVSADGFASVLTDPVAPGKDEVVVVMRPAITLAGRILEVESRVPISGLGVMAQLDGVSVEPRRAATSPDGSFEFRGLAPGRYLIAVTTEPYVLARQPLRVDVDSRTAPLELEVTRGGSVRGRVFDIHTNLGVPGVTLLLRRDNDSLFRKSTTTTASGAFEFIGIPEGEANLRLGRIPPGYCESEFPRGGIRLAMLPREQIDNVEVPLERAGTVSGVVVTSEGDPVGGAVVYAHSGNWIQEVVSCPDGTFTLSYPPEVEIITLAATSPWGHSRTEEILSAPTSGHHSVRLILEFPRSASINGTLVDRGGRPLQAELIAWPEDDSMLPVRPPVCESDDDGQFTLVGLIPGRHRILARPGPSEQKQVGRVTLGPGQYLGGLRLVYDSSELASVSGRVWDTAGRPVRATLIVTSPGKDIGAVDTGVDGAFVINGLGPGEYALTAHSRGYASETRWVVLPSSDTVDFVLQPLVHIYGRVVDQVGKPIRTCELTAESVFDDSPPEAVPRTNNTRILSNAEGRFHLELQPGTYWLGVSAHGFLPGETRVDTSQFDEGDEVVITLTPE